MKEIITSHLSEMKLKVFIDYLDSYSCEIYYHKGMNQLKNEDGTWSNLIIPISSLSCIDNFEYNDEGYCDNNSKSIAAESIVHVVTRSDVIARLCQYI